METLRRKIDSERMPTNEIYLPMRRTEIGKHIGLSHPAVSRAFRTLTARGVVGVRNRRLCLPKTKSDNIDDAVPATNYIRQ
jgi:hypothetical protein